MRALVTGGAGYIGSVLVPALLQYGHRVTVLDTFPRGDASLAGCCSHPWFDAVRGDARDEGLMRSLIRKCDAVVPLAALVGAPLCDRCPIDAVSVNRDAVVSLVRALSRDQMLIFPTTNSGYGVGDPDSECTEESPLSPLSLYARTKVEAETAVLEADSGVTLRLATAFGVSPRMRLDLLVNDFTWRAVTDRSLVLFEGHYRRNFIHVRDIADAVVHSISRYAEMRGSPFNVGLSDANLTKAQLCERIRRQVPEFTYVEAPVGSDPDRRDYAVSNARMEATGWRARWSLDDGIRELLVAYRMMGDSRFRNT